VQQTVLGIVALLLLRGHTVGFAQEVLGEHPDHPALSRFAPAVGASGVVQSLLSAGPAYKVRIVYLVPSNREPQPDAEKILQRFGLSVQTLYRENMARQGYGTKTFEFETEEDGVIPKVHIVRVAQPDTAFHDLDYVGLWGRVLSGLASAAFLHSFSGKHSGWWRKYTVSSLVEHCRRGRPSSAGQELWTPGSPLLQEKRWRACRQLFFWMIATMAD
jgi:hypothetical protein